MNPTAPTLHERIYGCWLGKNCGGTLGAPLEKVFGEPEPFDVWWYPQLPEGGIPNDDLEMQLIWLKALEEVGPALTATDLARYWLDHVGYSFDEYGICKTNFRLGLLPPVSGSHNNWFADCMGCPIRSEIWACAAPGLPRVAARWAYADAICDHAGESVWGELFNVAVESAAFVVCDRDLLLDIGLSYVPEASLTARAIRAAREAHRAGLDWKTARRRVLDAAPHYNAQFSPPNLGFQVVGWLYGEDFGDAICKAVNCGYDTDCTGATVGAILGILHGRGGLPARWTEPLGDQIATSESSGGVRHLSDGPNPAPRTLAELTARVCRLAGQTLARHGGGVWSGDPADLCADDAVRDLWQRSPCEVRFPGAALDVAVDYGKSPVVVPATEKRLVARFMNRRADPVRLRPRWLLPDGWRVGPPAPDGEPLEIPAGGTAAVEWLFQVPARVENSQRLFLDAGALDQFTEPPAPVTLIGANRLRHSERFPADGRSDQELFDAAFPPEQAIPGREAWAADARPGRWQEFFAPGDALPLAEVFRAPGILYVQTFLWTAAARTVRLHLATNCPAKSWLNGESALANFRYAPLRPNIYGYESGPLTGELSLAAGWNELLIKFVRGGDAPPFDAHLVFSTAEWHHQGLTGVGRTRFPWE